ncbi:putative isomerase YbhE [Moniliophthora roreri MCA 2997]|uniref:Isomerase YbhE n=1 Tax=Moniliophthora roreri (strain MCA 2997) TaxID=1381753 RepID=V2WTR6_MONRO|nr:putative isomerase YbhE [Moniliophthora roreri MCA 2997]
MAFTILAGGYDTFVSTYLFNATNASLLVTRKHTTGLNPSWLTPHPTNSSVFYAVNEVAIGALQSFTTSPDGVVTGPFDTVSSGGDSPAFALALSTGEVAVMNYGGGNGRIIPTTSDPLKFDNASAPVIAFPLPTNPVSERQAGSHPHQVVEHGEEVLVPDLGGDVVWRLTKDSGEWRIAGSIPQPSGSGPRHAAILDNRLFTLHELSSTLTVQAFPALSLNASAPLIANVSILPENPPAGAQWGAAEILIPPTTKSFPTSYIYVSNRNVATDPSALDPRGDTIAIFEHVGKGTEKEGLKLVKQVYTGLSQIRGMEIGPATNGGNEFLVAAGVAGTGGTVVFRRIDGGADLEEVARNTDIETRTTFIWVEPC